MPNESPAPWKVRQAIEQALDRGETHYTDRPGIPGLRQAVSASLRQRFGLETNPKGDVIVTCGLTEARFLAIQQALQPGETVAAPAGREHLDGPAVLRRIQVTTTEAQHALYVTSNTPAAALQISLETAPSSAWILYEVNEEQTRFHPAQLPFCADRTFTLGTLGAPGERVGYLASPPSFSSGLRDFKQALTICTTNLSQWAALAGMEEE